MKLSNDPSYSNVHKADATVIWTNHLVRKLFSIYSEAEAVCNSKWDIRQIRLNFITLPQLVIIPEQMICKTKCLSGQSFSYIREVT